MSFPAVLRTSIIGTALPQPVFGQRRSNASLCVTCHETHGLRPVLQNMHPRHVDHGLGDLGVSCRGGDPAAEAREVELDAGLAQRAPIPPTSALASLAGGVVFGVGMATAAYCPGTVVAEEGEPVAHPLILIGRIGRKPA